MTDHLDDSTTFEGEVTTEAELVANGGLTVGPGGMRYGEPAAGITDSWPVHTRVRVANVAERDDLVAWRAANAPISTLAPLLVWRADGSTTGVEEITTDGVNWYAESALAGDIEMTLATVAPYGWVLMQGQLLANAAVDYPALWAAADPALRVGGSLRIPDMRGRSPMGVGQGTGLTLRNMGDEVGAELATLSVANLPAHTHTGVTNANDRSLNHTHYMQLQHILGANPGGTALNFETHGLGIHPTSHVYQTSDPSTNGNLDHLHSFTTAPTGNGTGHANVHPAAVVNFKVKV